ncbi:TonB-dependent receptor [Steroidobacter cummioxidans]|uniref:TonB-dependent receptor n=1 Tax=Steroidobacter cummioxidans TaxID=1803913 RepID=UPI0019D45986|nr:TonB-dependent receptor [Steroidobacter cummioxidans]
MEIPTVVVVGTTPLPGLGTALRDVPANVQIYTSKDLARQRQATTTDYLEQNPTGISSNAAQGNMFQPDINLRGFTASPLLGTPQGVSVFQDGVRVNEPFGDVVNWDLIPQSAIASLQLIPGSNPAFGLNTLGGALAVYTKSGAQFPGGGVELSGGSFGRKSGEVDWGGSSGVVDWFLTADATDDDGWADHNPSRVRRFFGKVGWQNQTSDLDVSFTGADNTLQGTQTLPRSFLDDIRQAYTFPDKNENKLAFVTVKGSHFFRDEVLLGGNLYYRNYRTSNLSSNVNDEFSETGIQATNDASDIKQGGYGGGLQLVLSSEAGSRKNQLMLGATVDIADARFTQKSQDAAFTPDRNTVGIDDFELETDADTTTRYLGAFIADTFNLNAQWTLSASGRYNQARVRIEDRTGEAPLLNGEHTFSRFNPAVGINFNPNQNLTAYASYNEGMRAPTAIELTCADPDAPCKLPNDFLADPPLDAVISKTVEVGGRGRFGTSWRWNAAVYRTRLENDITFISAGAGATNAGFFANVGSTRRQGVELGLEMQRDPVSFAVRYTFLDATFRSSFAESSPANSSADEQGIIQVEPGDRIPSIPRHVLKVRADWSVTSRLFVGANVLTSAGVYARGDENNQDINGQVPGYTVVNLDARYLAGRRFEVFVRINNLFDRRYFNFGVVGENFFTGPDRTFGPAVGIDPVPEQFRGPGAPFGAWLGVRYSFGRQSAGRVSDTD